jgi:hypothetical protein
MATSGIITGNKIINYFIEMQSNDDWTMLKWQTKTTDMTNDFDQMKFILGPYIKLPALEVKTTTHIRACGNKKCQMRLLETAHRYCQNCGARIGKHTINDTKEMVFSKLVKQGLLDSIEEGEFYAINFMSESDQRQTTYIFSNIIEYQRPPIVRLKKKKIKEQIGLFHDHHAQAILSIKAAFKKTKVKVSYGAVENYYCVNNY